MIANSVEAINASIALKQEALNKVTNRKDYARIEAEIKAEQAKLNAITGNTVKQDNEITSLQSRINQLMERQAQDRIRQQVDLETKSPKRVSTLWLTVQKGQCSARTG